MMMMIGFLVLENCSKILRGDCILLNRDASQFTKNTRYLTIYNRLFRFFRGKTVPNSILGESSIPSFLSPFPERFERSNR